MNDILKSLLIPLVGGLIGYVTNYLAIKMLFHPYKAVYLGQWHIPFTPGLIPQQKDRIAAALGNIVSGQLLDMEAVKGALLSEDTLQALRTGISVQAGKYKDDPRTVGQLLENYIPSGKLDDYKVSIQEKGTHYLMDKLLEDKVGAMIVQRGMDVLKEKLQYGMLGMFLNEKVLKGIENMLTQTVNDVIAEEAPDIIRREIGKMETSVLDIQLCSIYESQKERLPGLEKQLVGLYRNAVENHLGKILETVNVRQIVAEKVSSFDAAELEQMIFGIMKRELNAIVYLGALLGFLLGFLNLLLMKL